MKQGISVLRQLSSTLLMFCAHWLIDMIKVKYVLWYYFPQECVLLHLLSFFVEVLVNLCIINEKRVNTEPWMFFKVIWHTYFEFCVKFCLGIHVFMSSDSSDQIFVNSCIINEKRVNTEPWMFFKLIWHTFSNSALNSV